MPTSNDIPLGLSKEISIKPSFSLSPGDNSNLTVEENGTLSLNLEIANSPFESVNQYGLSFQFKGLAGSYPIEGDLPDIGNTGQLNLSGLRFHKPLEGAPDEILGKRWTGDTENLTITLSIQDSAPLVFPSYKLPLDYSTTYTWGNTNLLTADKRRITLGETNRLEARFASDLEGFSCKVMIFEQDGGGLPTKWKKKGDKIILKGKYEYEAIALDLIPDEEDSLLHKADWQLGVSDGIFSLGKEEEASPETYEWSLIFLLYKTEPEISGDFTKIKDSALCQQDNHLALISDKPKISSIECSSQTVKGNETAPDLITEYQISYSLTFQNIVRIPSFTGQLLSIVQIDDPEKVMGTGSAFTQINGNLAENAEENTVLSGTFTVAAAESIDLANCRLFLDIRRLFNHSKHCDLPESLETVATVDGNNVVTTAVAEDADIQGWLIPLTRN